MKFKKKYVLKINFFQNNICFKNNRKREYKDRIDKGCK